MKCEHGPQALRFKVSSVGVRMYRYQCTVCGMPKTAFLKKNEINETAATPWDSALEEQTYKRQSDEWTRKAQESREAYDLRRRSADAEWRAAYEAHLRSDRWRELCRIVKERDRGMCQGCLRSAGSHVHHRTYEHMGDELLFELVLLCRGCHEKIHPRMAESAA